MLYIPITFKVDGRPDSSVFQSVIAAEGITPYLAKTFAGMGGGRSGVPRLTSAHPLNPFEDRVLLYSKLPRLPVGEVYGDIWHMTAFVCVDENEVQIIGACNVRLELENGLQIKQSEGPVLFTNPQNVTFIFADETNHDYRMGLRATPYGKHDDVFRFRLLAEVEKENIEICDLTNEDVSEIKRMELDCDAGALRDVIEEGEFEERYQGAELGYGLSHFCGVSNPVVPLNRMRALWSDCKKLLQEMVCEKMLPAKVAEKQQKSLGKEIAKNIKKITPCIDRCDKFTFSRALKLIPESYQKLLAKYCRLLCSHPFSEWNWADNAMRAEFVKKVLEDCIIPTLKEMGRKKSIDSMRDEMMLIIRRFNEPYTFLLEDKMLKSPFVIALWRVMNSEGRHDRIKEVLTLYPGDYKAHLTLAIYGAMCGYAGFSTKRLLASPEVDGVPMVEVWIRDEVLGRSQKESRGKSRQVKASQVKEANPMTKKSLSSKKEWNTERQGELNLGV